MTASERDSKPSRTPRRVRLILASVFLTGALAGGAAAVAVDASAHGWGAMHGGRHHGGRMGATQEQAIERMQLKAARALGAVDATDEQRQQVDAILQGMVKDVFPLREAHHANRKALLSELSRPAVDPKALEKLRVAELELADRFSRALVSAMAGISTVLEPEQRQTLTGFLDRRHH